MEGPAVYHEVVDQVMGHPTLTQSLDSANTVGEALLTLATSHDVSAIGALSAASSFLFGPMIQLATSTSLGAGVAAAGASAATGAYVARLWSDAVDKVFARRLAEVRKHAALEAPANVDLVLVVRQLLASLDWSFSVEEQKPSCVARGLHFLGFNKCVASVAGSSGVHLLASPISDTTIRRRLNKHIRGIWRQCGEQPSLPKRARARSRRGSPIWNTGNQAGNYVEKELREREEYEKLFNPLRGSVTAGRGLCSGLCYLVTAFLEIRHGDSTSQLHDAHRNSLRLAVAALARHPSFDDIADSPVEQPAQRVDDGDDSGDSRRYHFLQGALAVLCFLDAALAWRRLDPLGLSGECEDGEGLLVGHQRGSYSYSVLAAELRRCLNKSTTGCRVLWRRLRVHLDALRVRALPAPWPWAWVHTHEASMLVRNKTKVPLRFELYNMQAGAAAGSPRNDWRLIMWARYLFGLVDEAGDRPILSARVRPGIEWAMRPKPSHGQQFRMSLVTDAGVVVCSKRIRRGQTFDFAVNVPPRKVRIDTVDAGPTVVAHVPVRKARISSVATNPCIATRVRLAPAAASLARRATSDLSTGFSEALKDIELQSVDSTAAPSEARSSRMSVHSEAPSAPTGGANFERGSLFGKIEGAVLAEPAKNIDVCVPEDASMVFFPNSGGGRQTSARLETTQEEAADREFHEKDVDTCLAEDMSLVTPACPGKGARSFHLGSVTRRGVLATSEIITAAICPRCLRDMPARCNRPAAQIYAGGVQCDRCSVELVSCFGVNQEGGRFYHCSRCWFDLCCTCAVREMKQVWWSDDD
eukprot:TRINITY_DN15200_c0_g2_i1.p1 TRINITY_DN15200_c0_g2~~TRINITY_DN15200_c0_g2_i1.p1  ORF type:complete len:812 (+),score=104.65 TRINITY_DN15200_c0_g2_i1:170-2605(+)